MRYIKHATLNEAPGVGKKKGNVKHENSEDESEAEAEDQTSSSEGD